MTEAIIILMNMRGGCATVGDKVHALFRVNGRSARKTVERISDGNRNSEPLSTSHAAAELRDRS